MTVRSRSPARRHHRHCRCGGVLAGLSVLCAALIAACVTEELATVRPSVVDADDAVRTARTVVASTEAGDVRGFEHDGVAVFRGIPFAHAERFQPPRRVPPWRPDERDATRFGPLAPQKPSHVVYLSLPPWRLVVRLLWYALTRSGPLARDWREPAAVPDDAPRHEHECLTVNVATPAGAVGARAHLPVLVFIHGGGFVTGGGGMRMYADANGRTPYAAHHGVTVVTFNYRLGLLGFLKVAGGTYNNGVRDQLAALEWVQRNIAAFGGDARRVTVMGNSAGAMSVAALLAAGAAQRTPPLFTRAILQSGAAHNALSVAQAQRVARHVRAELHVSADTPLAVAHFERLGDAEFIALGNALDAPRHANALGLMPLQPVVDGTLIAQQPLDAVRHGAARGVEFIVATTADEYVLLMLAKADVVLSDAEIAARVRRCTASSHGALFVHDNATHVEHSLMQLLHAHAAQHGLVLPQQRYNALMTRVVFAAPAALLAEAIEAAGGVVYRWRLDHAPPVPLFAPMRAALHGVEVPLTLGVVEQPWLAATATERTLNVTRAVVRAYAEFVSGESLRLPARFDGMGDAAAERERVPWPRYGQHHTTVLFDDHSPRPVVVDMLAHDALERAVVDLRRHSRRAVGAGNIFRTEALTHTLEQLLAAPLGE